MALDFISLILGLAGGFVLAAGFLGFFILRLEREKTVLKTKLEHEQTGREEMGGLFALTAQEALKKSNEQFLQLAQEKMKQAQADGDHDLEKRQKAIHELIKPVQKQLDALGGAVEQIKGTDKALRDDLKNLSRETARLVGTLRDPAAQGKWGEFILEGLLDKSGLIKGVHYETQVSIESEGGRQRPDAVIHMQDGLNVIIDAKAPLNEFADKLGENMSTEEMQRLMKNLAKQVREHVKILGRKNYWEKMESPDFVILFLPSEHMFSIALRTDPDLVDYAAENDIVIASPTLLMSLLRVVALSWRQVELAKNAEEISSRGAELYKRLQAFYGHMDRVGKGIGTAMKGYNDAVGSLERSVTPAARKFKDLQLQGGNKDLPALNMLEDTPRALSAPEALTGPGEEPDDVSDEQPKKRA